MRTIAIIGTGNMGAPMSVNLAEAGFRVQAYDIVPEKIQPLVQYGVIPCASHAEAINQSELVLTMLPSGLEVKDVYFNHVIGQVPSHCVLVDSSTIDLEDARLVHQQAQQHNLKMLDAPVSGGTAGAKAGTLTFMVGGVEEVLDSVQQVLQAMAGKIIFCGGPGMGQAAKMCNNMMLGIQMGSVVEGFHLAKKVGLSDQKLYEVASNSSANCFSLNAFCPVPDVVENAPANNQYIPGFSTDLMLKDMGLALNAANTHDLDLVLGPIAADLYKNLSSDGNGNLDFSAIYRLFDDS